MDIRYNGAILEHAKAVWKNGSSTLPPEGTWVLVCFEQESRVKPPYAIMQVDEEGVWWNWDNSLDVEDKLIYWTELPEIHSAVK